MLFTKSDQLVTGGMDSNVKVWRSIREPMLNTLFIFMKHTDKIVYIRSFNINGDEFILSADDIGAIYYWKIGGYKAERYIPVDEKSLVDGNNQLIFTMSAEGSNIVLKKYSFVKRTLISKVYVDNYEDRGELEVKALIGFNDSEFFHQKGRGV